MNRFWREPLLHFLAIGIGLFFIYGFIGEGSEGFVADRIVVDREGLLTFMQFRSKTFDATRFNQILDELPETERQSLIDDYVREEALYREAKALGLDQNDYVARRRLIQQLEFITRGFLTVDIRLSEKDLQAYLDENGTNYFVPEKITFTHVFYSAERHGADKAEKLAKQALNALNAKRVAFYEGISWGDRFLYHRNYVGKTEDEIASHFGASMQEQVFAIEMDERYPDKESWHGPAQSPYGFHLVMVTKKVAGYMPGLAAVRQRVEQDALQAKLRIELDKAFDDIVTRYKVHIIE